MADLKEQLILNKKTCNPLVFHVPVARKRTEAFCTALVCLTMIVPLPYVAGEDCSLLFAT
jgi:hypothetical protein